jgi:hypothetical protein
MTFAFSIICLWCGLRFGRRTLRWLIATLLPPRLVTVFSFLWIVDGRELPVLAARS